MTTQTRRVLRERLLVEGMKGSSKSYQWLKIAQYLLKSGSNASVRVIDTDDAIERMLEEEFPELIPEEGGNVHIYPVYEWPEYQEAKNILLKESQQGDWNVIDMADNAWKTVQNYFTGEVFKKDIGDYFLEQRIKLREQGDMITTRKGKKQATKLETLKGWVDWIVVNKLYDDFMLPLVYKSAAHLYLTAGVDVVSKDDDEDTRDLYGPFGVKPRGQKNLAHQVHTEFLFQQGDRQNTWLFTTIKDRGRRYLDHAPLIDLVKQYYRAIVGWE